MRETHDRIKLMTSSVCSSLNALDTGAGDRQKSGAGLAVATLMVGVMSMAEKAGENASSVRAPRLGLGDLDMRNVGVLSLMSMRSVYSGSSAPGLVASALGMTGSSGSTSSGLNSAGAGGRAVGLGMGPPRFIMPDATAFLDSCFRIISFSVLRALASVSVCSIVSRNRAMSISSSLV